MAPIAALGGWLGVAFAARAQLATGQQPPRAQSSMMLACSVDRPIAWAARSHGREGVGGSSRESASFRVDRDRRTDRVLERGGDLEFRQRAARHIFRLRPREQPTNGAADCTVRVVVQPAPDSRGRESGWSFLVGAQTEESGYGLYSYLVLGSPPDDNSRDRYRQAIEAYVGLVPDIQQLGRLIERRELNVTYLPLTLPPPGGPVALDWALDHYDYVRARALLRRLPGDYREGPYLISSLEPLTGKTAAPARYLFQDLSRVPPRLTTLWVKEFLNQAAQERFWEESTARALALKLRTTIAVLTVSLPAVRETLEQTNRLETLTRCRQPSSTEAVGAE
jgi:hypothetical protein